MATRDQFKSKPSVQVPLANLALVCLIFALACLATLVIVVSVKGIDVLSTVALALAILAFVVQLIVYIVQAAQVTEQGRLSSELHAEMMSVLAQLQERTQGTQQSVDRMNVRLLEAVIGKATADGVAADSPGFAARIVDAVSSAGGTGERGRSSRIGADYPAPLEPERAASINAEISTPLSASEAGDVEDILANVDEFDRHGLAIFARDVYQFTRPDSIYGPGAKYNSEDLIRRGLIEQVPGWQLFTLTAKGRKVGRLFTAGLASGVSKPSLVEIKESSEKALSR